MKLSNVYKNSIVVLTCIAWAAIVTLPIVGVIVLAILGDSRTNDE